MRIRLLTPVALAVAGVFLTPAITGLGGAAHAAENQELRISSMAADISTLDPHRATSTSDKAVVGQIFNGLVRFPPGSADPSELEAALAESWEVSDDNTVWTFTLRKGVPFHHGYGELTAEDVVFSLQRAADPDRSSFSTGFSGVKSIEALDDYTVEITLEYPDVNFLGLVSDYHGGNIVSKKAVEELGDKFGSQPVGTGAFAFDEHNTQQYVKLAAHNDYFRGQPEIASVTFQMIPSDSARELAFNSGEIDIAHGKREQRWVERIKDQGVNIDIFEPAEYRNLHLNRNYAPLDDLRVRQAIAAAIDVDQIVQYVGADVADKGCSVVPQGYIGHTCEFGGYEHNIDKAKALLKEAGHPDGITIKSVVSNISAQLPIMEVIQAQLAAADITLDMEVVDHATYHAKSREDQSAIVFYGAARFPVADTYLSEFFDSAAEIGSPTAMSNFSHCSVADEQIRAAKVEPDEQKQLQLWHDAQTKIFEDVCAIPLFGLKQVWMHSDDVDYGYELTGALNLAPMITEQTRLNK